MKNLILAAVVISCFAACKKSKTEEPTPTPQIVVVPKIKTTTIGGDLVTSTYDNQGRLLTKISPVSNWKYEYVYGTNLVTENYYVGTTLSTSKNFELNADGFITKETYNLPITSIPFKTLYTYNANKQLQTKVSSNTMNSNGNTETYFYTGTILDSMRTTFNQNNDLYRFFYTYYTDKLNSFGYKNQGLLFFAETGDNPVKKQTSIFRTNGFFNTQVDDFTYIFDAQNRITRRSILTVGSSTPSVNDITYY